MMTHFVIPDTQAKPGVPTDHLTWAGQYMVDKFAGQDDIEIIHLGDHADMPSLSSYDKGKRSFEGRRYRADIEAANAAFDVLCDPLDRYNRHRVKMKEKQWLPSRRILLGNHENRIERATENMPELDGTISVDDLNYAAHGWKVHPFLEPVYLDGVGYAHYWYQPMNGRPYSGQIETRLKAIGHSFSMGHQQGLLHGIRYVAGKGQHGLVAGSFYPWAESYKGPQGNDHWRGVVVCYEVEDGDYCPMFVSLDYLCRRYEGRPLGEFMTKKYGADWATSAWTRS
jgi:hypothetical protein